MKRIALLTLILLTGFTAAAQNFKERERSFRNWIDGPLAESDFVERHVSTAVQGVGGELDWLISFDPVTDRIGNLRYRHLQSSTRMDRLSSWRDPSSAKPWTMEYFQTEFNMIEVFRRKLQAELNVNPLDYRDIKDYYLRLLSSNSDTYMMETDHGNDAAAVARYSVQYKEALEKDPESEAVKEPQIPRRALGYGVFFGYMGECYGAPVSTAIGPLFHGFSYGFDLPIRRVYLGFEGTLGAGGILKQDGFYHDSHYDYHWERGKKCTNGEMGALLGYIFLDRPGFALCPVAGVGVSFLDQKTGLKENGGTGNSEIHGLRLQAGLNFSVKLKRTLDVSGFYGSGSYDETNLVFKVNAAHTQFQGLGEIWSVQFGVAVDFIGWFLKNGNEVKAGK